MSRVGCLVAGQGSAYVTQHSVEHLFVCWMWCKVFSGVRCFQTTWKGFSLFPLCLKNSSCLGVLEKWKSHSLTSQQSLRARESQTHLLLTHSGGAASHLSALKCWAGGREPLSPCAVDSDRAIKKSFWLFRGVAQHCKNACAPVCAVFLFGAIQGTRELVRAAVAQVGFLAGDMLCTHRNQNPLNCSRRIFFFSRWEGLMLWSKEQCTSWASPAAVVNVCVAVTPSLSLRSERKLINVNIC